MSGGSKIGSAASEADSLFRRFTVAAIRNQDHSIKNDIEGKRQDLRLMVGERYRDLIDAADSIMAMRQAAQSIQGMFGDLSDRCNISSLKRSAGDSATDGEAKAAAGRDATVYRVAAQIKLLVDTPEQIWYTLERSYFLQSAQLYLLAKHVYRNLQSMRDSPSLNALDVFPVARRQWDAVSRFQSQIVQKTHQSLKFIHQSDQAIANAVCAIILLENVSVRQAIKTFFEMRRQALDDLLATFDPSTTDYTEFLAEVAKLIHMTVRQAWGVFGAASGTRSLVEQSLAKLDDPSVARSGTSAAGRGSSAEDLQSSWLSGLFSERTNIHIMVRHLPPGLREQTVTIAVPLDGSADEVAEEAIVWIKEITRAAKTGVANVLRNVTSGQRLWTIREKVVLEVLKEESSTAKTAPKSRQNVGGADEAHNQIFTMWSEVCRLLVDHAFSVWNSVLREPFVNRAKDVIRDAFDNMANQPTNYVAARVDKFAAGTSKAQERFFVEDPRLVAFNSSSNATNSNAGMSPWSNTVSEVASLFDKSVQEIQIDVEVFLTPPKESTHLPNLTGEVVADPTFEQDAAELRKTFAESGVKALAAYGNGLEKLLTVHHAKAMQLLADMGDMALEASAAVDQCLLIGRIARSIVMRCRALFLLFSSPELANQAKSHPKTQRAVEKKLESEPHFVEARDLLLAIGEKSYLAWLVMVARQAGKWLQDGLIAEDWSQGLGFKEVWEAVAVKAEDENSQTVEESMSLPVQASPSIVDVLFRICQDMNRIGGHLVEKSTLRRLLAALARTFTATYNAFVEDNLASISDKGALQLLFDNLFLTKILGDALSDQDEMLDVVAKEIGPRQQSALVNKLRSMIDPIDLSISDRHMATNVDRFYYRTSVLFGPLLVLSLRGVETKHNPTVHEVHNTVALSSQASRFTLLPVIPLSSQVPGIDRVKTDFAAERTPDSVSRERPMSLAPSAAVVSPRQDARILRPQRKHIRLYGPATEEGITGATGAGSGMSVLSSLVEQGGKALLSSLGGLLTGSD